MKQNINEIKRMQQLAGVINESQISEEPTSELTREEKLQLDEMVDGLINNIANTSIVEKEELALEYIVTRIKEITGYYPDSV